MKSLRPRTLLSPSPNSPPLFLRISRFSASYYDPHSHSHSHSHFAQNPLSSSRRDDDRSRGVRVSVWWDFENCNLPAGVNVFRVAAFIAAAVRASGIRGPIQITAFGDVLQLSRSRQEALSATGINMTHVPHGGKNSADRSLLADLMYWVSQNPPPAHLFLISGDRDFASILHKLRMSNYNILLASPESAPPVLCSAASIMWNWNSLVKGENLTGKHFNQPPDGPYGSWYGHCKLPLEDPFAVTEQPRLGSENLSRPVPQAVMRQIWRLVRSSPKGIPITELRAELGRSNLHLDKDLYGYKKFSQFLMSMPHIIKLQHQGDGQFLVQAVTKKPQSSLNSIVDPSTRSINESGEEGCTSSDADDELMHAKRATVEKLPPSELNMDLTSDKEPHRTSPEAHVAVPPKKVGEQHVVDKEALEKPTTHAALSEVTNSDADEELMQAKRAAIEKSPLPAPNTDVTSDEAQQWPSPDERVACASKQDSTSIAGLFKRFWTRWFGVKDSSSNKNNVKMSDFTASHRSKEMSNDALEESSTPSDDSVEVKVKEKCPTQVAEPNCLPSSASTSNQSAHVKEGASRMETLADKCIHLPNDSGMVEEINNHSTMGNTDTLWSDMKSSLSSAKGSATVGKSKTRREMARNLQKDRLPAAKSLSDNDLLHFVDLLKGQKSVEEDPSQNMLFKPEEHCPHASNRLSSVFQGNPSLHTELQRPFEHNGEKKIQNTDARVSLHLLNKIPNDRLRNKILADCQKLVNEILKEYPGGYNIRHFKKLFLEKHGYPLDPQRLGCEELTSVLEMMAGVTVESTHIYPAGKASKCQKMESAHPNVHQSDPYGSVGSLDIELRSSSKKDDRVDSLWEELRPVADEVSGRNDLKQEHFTKGEAADVDYNPELSDSDFLELEDEANASGEEAVGTQKEDTVHSSPFEEVINSYYTKKSNSESDKSTSTDGMSESSSDTVQPSDRSRGMQGKASFQCSNGKRRLGKSYSFVADPETKVEGRPFNGILDSMDKSNESRMHG
ncbi:hypothetical protein BT93_I0125 [Corymbia citriodora subsp. variegata]|nr:hypothetical protein BT93_I0125 [Corymbia citriodora subsp. variegata]KAF8011898.1 hypothetical protein BT93_I0125 [Corymbia citriodora subsp. variegata]